MMSRMTYKRMLADKGYRCGLVLVIVGFLLSGCTALQRSSNKGGPVTRSCGVGLACTVKFCQKWLLPGFL
jgi:hypothetical protein